MDKKEKYISPEVETALPEAAGAILAGSVPPGGSEDVGFSDWEF